MLRTPLIFLPSRQRTWAAIQRDRGPCGSRCARREGVHHAHGGGPGGQSRQGACGGGAETPRNQREFWSERGRGEPSGSDHPVSGMTGNEGRMTANNERIIKIL